MPRRLSTPSGNEEKNMKNLNKAMAKLLKNYPPN